ncbi:MAG TPA: response regulator [Planctomycetota bacterium]|nr:response regulator [Planctomycetota bacterium]
MIHPSELVSVLDAILEGIQVVSPEWRYLHVNDAAAHHGRSTKQALIGRSMLECYPGIENTPLFEVMRRCMHERRSHVLENAFTFPDGSVGHFELRIAPVPQGICVLSIDVTDRKQAEAARAEAEERLARAQRLEAIGVLAAGIAHDFNNQLMIIMGAGHAALAQAEGPIREEIETILAAAGSAAQMTRHLLANGGRAAASYIDPCRVAAGFEQVLLRSLPTQIELAFDMGRDVGAVNMDRGELEQILMNLVLNARDASSGVGRITISVRSTCLGPEFTASHPGARVGPHTVIAVTDKGAGMDAATRARIFEPFFSTKESSSGLGLASVHSTVRRRGGFVSVRSEPGAGASFEVYLPSAPAPRADVVDARAASTGSTILFVDDMPEVGRLVAKFFEADSHRVLLATSGEQALALWHEHGAAVDLLVTDISMPGLSGPDLVARMRAQRPGLPVLFMSGFSDSELACAGGMPKDVAFLEKPFAPTQLLELVHELLARRAR